MFHTTNKPDWRQEFKRLEGAYAPNTLRSYFACFQSFEDWACERGFTPIPARPSLVAAYVQSMSPELSPATLRNRICAIRKVHALLRYDDPTGDELVNLAIRRARRSMTARPRQARGITPETLRKMISVQPDNITGIRNAALLQVGYEILARRSELTALKLGDLSFLGEGAAKVIIRRGKADPYGSGRSGQLSRKTVYQLQRWLQCRNPNSDWLFQPVYKNVSIPRSISYTTLKRVILKSLEESGVDDFGAYSGHSLRVGAAQELLRRGHSTSTIMRAGGWKSVNVLARYLEEAEINLWEGKL
jgi:integrase